MLKGRQWLLISEERRQRVPCTGRCNWKCTVSQSPSSRSWNDRCRRVSRTQVTAGTMAGCQMQGLGEVPWRCTVKASSMQYMAMHCLSGSELSLKQPLPAHVVSWIVGMWKLLLHFSFIYCKYWRQLTTRNGEHLSASVDVVCILSCRLLSYMYHCLTLCCQSRAYLRGPCPQWWNGQ